MKLLSKILILLLVGSLWSCRDTKEAEKTTDVEVTQEVLEADNQDNSIDAEVDKASEEVEKEVEELDNVLKELDTI